jgi:hypothetical protein
MASPQRRDSIGTRGLIRRDSMGTRGLNGGAELNGQGPDGYFDGDGVTEGRVLRYGDEVSHAVACVSVRWTAACPLRAFAPLRGGLVHLLGQSSLAASMWLLSQSRVVKDGVTVDGAVVCTTALHMAVSILVEVPVGVLLSRREPKRVARGVLHD